MIRKILAGFLLIIGAVAFVIGLIPFVSEFPYTTSRENSGPKNYWELLIYISYDGWYLQVGIVMLLVGFLLYKKTNYQFN